MGWTGITPEPGVPAPGSITADLVAAQAENAKLRAELAASELRYQGASDHRMRAATERDAALLQICVLRGALETIALHAPASHASVNSYGELSGSCDCYSCARKVDMAKDALNEVAEKRKCEKTE